jgi:hypothetical protein
MEDKKGVKRERSPSAEGSPLLDDAKTATPVPSGSPSPLGSPLDISSHCRCSSAFEQGGASGVVDTSRDEEFIRKLFGDLNRDILGPPDDGKITIIDDSDNDDEAQEEETVGVDPMTVPAPAADAPAGTKVNNSDDQGSDQEADGGDNNERSVGNPWALRMHYSAFSLFLSCPL